MKTSSSPLQCKERSNLQLLKQMMPPKLHSTLITLTDEEPSKPILSALTTSRSGWASFLSWSSRGLIVESSGYGSEEGFGQGSAIERAPKNEEEGQVSRHENGMEVMEIDPDENGELEMELRKALG
ncbi:LOW QUALITY PROTEIN: hypothetical protein CVT26_004358 [Gymnopilus dilepis]|uniref:Uncharacterized protein n=1 Tax=Gymnopilus dilepis TaxID=231916 RepID=A0A409W6S1_9AGAR|nr:LOW QUALITY PROTEIN: hypothetical protein CVT26_004358 [Gymnopilus dilepis]